MNARVRKVVGVAAAFGDDERGEPSREELARRIEHVVSGRVEARDLDDVLAELRAKYSVP